MTMVKKQKGLVFQARDELTGLSIVGEGPEAKFNITKRSQAERAVARIAEIEPKIEKLKLKLTPLEADRELLRKGLRDYQEEKKILELKHQGWVSQLIERTTKLWIFEERDIPANLDISELDEPIVPLFHIIKNKVPDLRRRTKLLNRVTRRIIDPVGLDEVVKSGKLTAQDVAPALLEYTQTAYVQVKPQK